MNLEHRSKPLLPMSAFLLRLARFGAIAAGVLAVSLGIGVLGYHWFASLSWLDALLNASMILTGMGPVDPMRTTASKVFASIYALFSGVIFLTVAALIFAPVFHRLIHRFHLELDDEAQPGRENGVAPGQKKDRRRKPSPPAH